MRKIESSHVIEVRPEIDWSAPSAERKPKAEEKTIAALRAPVPKGLAAHTRQSIASLRGVAENNVIGPLEKLVKEGKVIRGTWLNPEVNKDVYVYKLAEEV